MHDLTMLLVVYHVCIMCICAEVLASVTVSVYFDSISRFTAVTACIPAL